MKVKIKENISLLNAKYEDISGVNIFTLKITDKYKWLILPVKIIPTTAEIVEIVVENLEWVEYPQTYPYVVLNGVTNPKSISISVNDFGCLVTQQGKVICFGKNDQDQCTIPEEIKNQNVKQISCGYSHTVALLESGTIVGWGATGVGVGRYGAETIMGQITAAGLTVYKVDAGAEHALALLSNGDVVAWGKNEAAQLSDTDVYWTWPGYINPTWAGGYHPQGNEGFKYYTDKAARPNSDGSGRLYRCGAAYDNKRYNGCESLNRSILPQHYLWRADGTTVYPWAYVDSAAPNGWEPSTGAPYDYQFSRETTGDPSSVNYGGGGWIRAGESGSTSAMGTSFKKYKDISAGRSHNLVLATDGTIELWGDNFYYNVSGSGSHDLQNPIDKNCPAGRCYKRVGSGYGGTDPNLGITIDYGDNTAPTVKSFKTNSNSISKIATSYYGNIVIKPDGTVFSWDRNECGECTNLNSITGVTFSFVNGAYRHNLGIGTTGSLHVSGCWYAETGVVSSPYKPSVGSNTYRWAGGSRDWSVGVLTEGPVVFWGDSISKIKGFTLYN